MTPAPSPLRSRPRSLRVGEAFGKAHDYDANAAPQLACAARLAGLILRRGIPAGARVLDMGCGTGGLAMHLLGMAGSAGAGGPAERKGPRGQEDSGRIASYLCADIAPAMLGRARAKLSTAVSPPVYAAPVYAAMDARNPALKPVFHLVASNMALHWTEDLRAALEAIWGLVLPGGTLAVSIPGSETFLAWREAHERLGLACGLQDFPSAEDLGGMFPAPASITQEHHPLPLAHPLDLPRHLKAVGGRVPREGHRPLTPVEFRAVLAQLEKPAPDARPLGYHVLYALARKEA